MKHRIAAVLLTAFTLLALLAATVAVAAAEAPRMDKDDLKALLGDPEVVIIDVRAHTAWLLSRQKITGAARENYRDFDGWTDKYPRDKTIVLYCS